MMKSIIKKFVSVLLLLFLATYQLLLAQEVPFDVDDFKTTGTTYLANDQCFVLTESLAWQGGGLWFKNRVDLNEPFSMEIDLFFGCEDDHGADGIVFIFHPTLRTGFRGEGMGFGGLFPSFGIEMDTYFNGHLGDPEYDHVALMIDGMTSHRRGFTNPIRLKADQDNVEDCKPHRVKIEWKPEQENLRFYFDGNKRIDQKVDLVDEVFSGRSSVYWGFTSATGGKMNKHMVCVEKLEFTEDLSLSYEDKEKLLEGGPYTIKKLDFASGSTKLPESAFPELNRLVDFFQENSSYTIILDGFTDSSGGANGNLRISKLRAQAVAEYLRKMGIPANRIHYYGNGENNPLYDNSTPEGRKKNRRVEIRMEVFKV